MILFTPLTPEGKLPHTKGAGDNVTLKSVSCSLGNAFSWLCCRPHLWCEATAVQSSVVHQLYPMAQSSCRCPACFCEGTTFWVRTDDQSASGQGIPQYRTFWQNEAVHTGDEASFQACTTPNKLLLRPSSICFDGQKRMLVTSMTGKVLPAQSSTTLQCAVSRGCEVSFHKALQSDEEAPPTKPSL